MPHSAVKAGLHFQRDRATKRRRDREEAPRPVVPSEQLEEWLVQIDVSTLAQLQAFDRKRFLQETGHIDMPPSFRLCALVERIELSLDEVPQPAGWLALKSFYDYALRLNEPNAWWVYYSAAHSGYRLLKRRMLEPAAADRIARDSIEAAVRATELAPQEVWAHYVLGQCYYQTDQLPEALECFDRAASVDPMHGWSLLLRGHVLRDLGRWQEAIRAYDVVPLDSFKGRAAAQIDLLKEMRAWCRLQHGDQGTALREFQALLARYEKEPGLAYHLSRDHFLVRAAASAFREQLQARTRVLLLQLGPDFGCCLRELDRVPM